MRVSVSWLRAIVPALAKSNLDARAIADKLTRAGLEVEGIRVFGAGIDPVVVAKVVEVRAHPSRASLKLVKVDRGEGKIQEVVCGAPNVPPPGGLVVLAPLGTHLPAANDGKGLTLEPRAIGGVTSEGMLCSEAELGIAWEGGGGHEGILVLPEKTADPGTPLRKAVPAVFDEVLEIGVTPNRPDALGHVGVARDLAAVLEVPFGVPEPAAPNRVVQTKIEGMARVSIAPEARARCRQYLACVVVDATIGPSPLWVRYRLHALGVRSISNAVDVTNLVMLEYGQPLHAFDLDRLDGSAIQVRMARDGEKVVTLDGVERTLVVDDLVVCDGGANGGKPVALAGVMGAGNSEISDATRRILLECAYFDPRSVRRTARRHGLHTESSHRFERGVDPGALQDVIAQAAALTVRLSGGAGITGMLSALGETYEPARVTLRHARLESLLGTKVDPVEARSILDRLGFEVGEWIDGACAVTAPTHRPDVEREVDLVEEIARVRGLDAIPTELPPILPQSPRTTGVLERRARHVGREVGLSEAVSYGFTSPRELEAIGAPTATIRILNPLGEERSVMRTSLLPGLLAAVKRSRSRGEKRIRLFEVGARFLEGGPEADRGLCDEVPSFAAVIAGPRDGWLGRVEELDVWDAKGVATEIVARLCGREPTTHAIDAASRPKHLHPRGAAELRVGDVIVGRFGPIHPDVVDRVELEGPALAIEIDLRAVESLGTYVRQFQALPTLPASTRDVALVAPETITAGALARALEGGAGETCERVEVFDLYTGEGVPKGSRSLAFRLTYRDPKMARTLTDAEVDALHAKAVDAAKVLGAQPRT
jgi:phenylalanyl-tRNA synthetase beta chain